MKRFIYLILVVLFFASCANQPSSKSDSATEKAVSKSIVVPEFSGDSAYNFVAGQLALGPRVPGLEGHQKGAEWLIEQMNRFADTVVVQEFKVRTYNKLIFDGQNIIASFNPNAKKRILLGAHWDSRPYADHDPDPANRYLPIDGANDGASGVGVLLELARLFKNNPLEEKLGVDIILFDMEDYGPHDEARTFADEEFWAMGAQHWARYPHIRNYQAHFGILLDMVGAADAVFPRETFSLQYAAWVLDRVWQTAARLGFGQVFINKQGAPISDDHVPVNTIAGIPMINIIHLDDNSSNGTFFEQWHTLGDNLDVIDSNMLKIVGQVVATVVYEAQ